MSGEPERGARADPLGPAFSRGLVALLEKARVALERDFGLDLGDPSGLRVLPERAQPIPVHLVRGVRHRRGDLRHASVRVELEDVADAFLRALRGFPLPDERGAGRPASGSARAYRRARGSSRRRATWPRDDTRPDPECHRARLRHDSPRPVTGVTSRNWLSGLRFREGPPVAPLLARSWGDGRGPDRLSFSREANMTRRIFQAVLIGLVALASAFAAAAATIPSPVHPHADPLRAAAATVRRPGGSRIRRRGARGSASDGHECAHRRLPDRPRRSRPRSCSSASRFPRPMPGSRSPGRHGESSLPFPSISAFSGKVEGDEDSIGVRQRPAGQIVAYVRSSRGHVVRGAGRIEHGPTWSARATRRSPRPRPLSPGPAAPKNCPPPLTAMRRARPIPVQCSRRSPE